MFALIVGLALAQSSTTTQTGQIGYRVQDARNDMGDTHLAAGVGVSVLGRDQRVFASGTALVELAPSLSVHSMGTLALHVLDDDGSRWFHAEAGVAFHRTTHKQTLEDVLLEQSSYTSGDTTYTNTNTARLPIVERNQGGVNLGAIMRQGRVRMGKDDDTLTPATMLLPYAGVFLSSGAGQSARIEGYGTRNVYRFFWAGIDAVYAGPVERELPATGDLSDFGLRFHTNVSIGRPGTVGFGGRIEVGALPGGLGGYLLASAALTTHLNLFGRRSSRPRRQPGDKSKK